MKKKSYKIVIFFTLLFVLMMSFVIPIFAYHEDSNGNLISDNILTFSDSTSTGLGVTYQCQDNKIYLSGTASSTGPLWVNINIEPGTYTFQLFNNFTYNDGFRLTLRNGYDRILTSCSYDTLNNYSTFTTTYTATILAITVVSGVNYDNVVLTPSLVVGSTPLSNYESYGSIYYSQNNYDNAYYRNYGLFGYCSQITVEISSSPVITDSWNGIQDLLNDKDYITMDNNIFRIRWASFLHEYTNDVTYRVSWRFYFDNTYPSISLYNSFTSGIANGNYQLTSSDNELLSYDSIPSGNSVDFSSYSSYNYGRFDWICGTPNVGLAFATLYFTNNNSNDYINGYNDGYSDGKDYSNNNVDVNSASYLAGNTNGYSQGYQVGQDYANSTIDINSASYQAGVSSQGGYNAGYAAGYALGRTEQSYITDTNTQGNDLIWTIASTPWESFKNIWNVNILGINLANLVTGFITAIILLWIIKRFWK